jgi:hypothetical protein
MFTAKDFSTALVLFSILYIFYLTYLNILNLPISIVVMLTIGSLLSAASCTMKHAYPFFNPKVFNYIITIFGIVIIVRQYM